MSVVCGDGVKTSAFLVLAVLLLSLAFVGRTVGAQPIAVAQSPSAQSKFHDAFELLRSKKYGEASVLFRDGLALTPEDANAWFYLAQAQYGIGNAADAASSLRIARTKAADQAIRRKIETLLFVIDSNGVLAEQGADVKIGKDGARRLFESVPIVFAPGTNEFMITGRVSRSAMTGRPCANPKFKETFRTSAGALEEETLTARGRYGILLGKATIKQNYCPDFGMADGSRDINDVYFLGYLLKSSTGIVRDMEYASGQRDESASVYPQNYILKYKEISENSNSDVVVVCEHKGQYSASRFIIPLPGIIIEYACLKRTVVILGDGATSTASAVLTPAYWSNYLGVNMIQYIPLSSKSIAENVTKSWYECTTRSSAGALDGEDRRVSVSATCAPRGANEGVQDVVLTIEVPKVK